MKITETELLILLDTLTGSLKVQDRGTFFRYTPEERRRVLDDILNRGKLKMVQVTRVEKK